MRSPARLKQCLVRNRGRIAVLMVMLVWLYFIVAFGGQAWRANQLQDEVAAQRNSIQKMRRENAALRNDVARLDTPRYQKYVASVARRDLDLAKPGETILLVRWDEPPDAQAEPAVTPRAVPDEKPNWQRWLDLFFDQQ